MIEQKQRRVIAEFCRWKWTIKNGNWGWLSPDRAFFPQCLDYTRDLNAMHEAEVLFLEQADHASQCAWLDNLYRSAGLNPYVWRNGYGSGKNNLTPPHGMVLILTLKPSQRAEALLRTIGKWKD